MTTPLGVLDSSLRPAVDDQGRVTLVGDQAWTIDWWIGGDDRWYLPTRSVSVRQHAIDNSPVIESRLRVPGGDVVHRIYVASAGGGEHLVIAVENESTIPVALALVIAPEGAAGVTAISSLQLQGATVLVNGRVGLVGPRPPGRVHLGSQRDAHADDDSVFEDAVTGGLAEPSMDQQIRCDDGLARGAFIWPMSHRANMIFTVPLAGLMAPAVADRATAATTDSQPLVPEAARVASGWRTQTDRAARVWLPDERLMAAQSMARTQLLLAAPSPDGVIRGSWRNRADVLMALVRWGYHRDAIDGLIASLDHERRDQLFSGVDSAEAAVAALTAVAEVWRLDGDPALARVLVEPCAAALHHLADGDADHSIADELEQIADLFVSAGEKRAAKGVVSLAKKQSLAMQQAGSEAGGSGEDSDPLRGAIGFLRHGDIRGWAALERGLSLASPVWSWPEPSMGLRFLDVVRSLAVVEDPASLRLVSLRVSSWLGAALEVHDLPTAHGPLSYAIRWHGDRPALLWELGEPVGAASPVTVHCGLDPSWSTTDRSGEALLAPVEGSVIDPSAPPEVRPMNHLPTAQHTGFEPTADPAAAPDPDPTNPDIDAEGGFL